MKKFKIILFGLLFIAIGFVAYSQDGNNESKGLIEKIIQWITGTGIVGIIVGIIAGWKKVVGFMAKVGLAIWDVSSGLANLLIQASEVSLKANTLGNKLAKYAEDGVYTKDELTDLALEFKSVAKEVKDLPPAIEQLKENLQTAWNRFKKK